MSLLRPLCFAAALVVLSSQTLQAADPQPEATAKPSGDLWEVTSQMSMEEMPMAIPAQTLQVCSPKEWKKPPAAMDERQKCQTSEFKIAGPKVTWKVSCPGPPAMTGVGEITRNGADAYSGAIKFTSEDGNMTMKLDGRRVGPCDNPQN